MAIVVRILWVDQGTLVLPGKTVPFWGLGTPGLEAPALPGPIINATVGDTVFVMLYRGMSIPVSLIFPGQRNVFMRRSTSGWERVRPQYQDGSMISLTNYLDPDVDAWIWYRFRAQRPGIYLYEAGTNPGIQVQMGIYGVIIIRPRGYSQSSPYYRTAYGADTGTNYDIERILVLGEIDTVLHDSIVQGLDYSILSYSPDYWIINGRSYPDTVKDDDDPSLPRQPLGSLIQARVGQRVLLRVINAGALNHTLHFGGLIGRVIAGDSFPLASSAVDTTYQKTAVTIGSGQSYDIIITPKHPGEYYLRAREYNRIVNVDSFPGGMLTKMIVTR